MATGFGLLLLRSGADRQEASRAALRAILTALQLAITGIPTTGPAIPVGVGHVETEVVNGHIVVQEGTPPEDLDAAIQARFPRDAWGDAARVSFYESGWRSTAERNTLSQAGGRCSAPIGALPDGTPIVSEDSVGYYQINICAHGHDRDYWRDADNNVAKAAQLFVSNGWRDWAYTGRRLGLL